MKKIFACILFLLFLMPFSVRADRPYVIDNAGLLTEEEAAALEAKLEAYSAEAGADIVILTESDLHGADVIAYADDFFDSNGYGQGKYYDGVLLMLAMDTRTWYISTSGDGVRAFPDWRIEEAGEEVVPYLSSGDYYTGFDTFAELSRSYFADRVGDYILYDNGDLVTFDVSGNVVTETNIRDLEEDVIYAIRTDGQIVESSELETMPGNYTYFMISDGELYEVDPDPYEPEPAEKSVPWAAFGTGSGVTGLLAALINVSRERGKLRSVNKKYQASEYYRDGSMQVDDARDVFLYRNVSRTRIETSSSRSGGGGGSHGGGGGSHVHISSSGHTHGGGGGHF